jgi:hypothetical protein
MKSREVAGLFIASYARPSDLQTGPNVDEPKSSVDKTVEKTFDKSIWSERERV